MKKVNNKGFSLVEILIAIALLGVLMTMAANAYNVYKKKARQQAYDTMAKTATTAATNYLFENAKDKYVSFETLKENEYIDTLQDPKYKDEQCSGIVINKVIQGEEEKKLDILFQKVKLCCKDYKYQYDYTGDEVKVTEIDSCEYVEGDEIDGVYKLIYKSNGGKKCNPEVIFKKQKETWGDLCVTDRNNFAFKGWNTKKNGKGTTITKDTVVGDRDISVYAIWNEIFALNFEEEGGTTCAQDPISKENGEEWGTLCITTKENYEFKGWRTKRNGGGRKITTTSIAEENLTVYAHWNPYITITLDSQGGSNCDPSVIKKEKGDEWQTLCTPTRSGYVFKGWNTKADGTGTTITAKTKADFNEDDKSKYTIYAIWNPIYTLTYNSNGGSVCTPNSKSEENGNEWGDLCTTYLSGYTFTGWKDEIGNVVTSRTKATKNTTLTASWRANCPDGYTYQTNGTCVKVYNASEKYRCNSGDTKNGTTCTKTTIYDADVSYTCNSGDTKSGTTCTKTTTTDATLSYTCDSGDTKDGTTCTKKTTYDATSSSSYSNCRWVLDSGHTSTSNNQSGAVWSATCNSSKRGKKQKFYDCGSGKISCRNPSTGKYNCQTSSCASDNLRFTYKEGTCTCDKNTTYTCDSGDTKNGTKCTKTQTYTATSNYECPSGTTLNETKCYSYSTYTATTNYNCNTGDTKDGTKCTNTQTYTATKYYECNVNDTLSGTTCTSIVTP